MKQERGKILFYNEKKGEGIIISDKREKYRFDVMDWDDFETMPQKGLDVFFGEDGKNAKNIRYIKEKKPQSPMQKTNTPQEKSLEFSKNPQAIHKEHPPKKDTKTQAMHYKNEELTKAEADTVDKISSFERSIETIGENIKLSVSIDETMKRYFEKIQKNIEKRQGYKKVQGRLNYLLAKRFLWTTFNNLREMDPHIITLRIKSISEDLKAMDALCSDFKRKIHYPFLAFEDIFLSNQKEYSILSQLNKKIKEKLNQLKSKEENIAALKKSKQKELHKIGNKKSETYKKALKELKTINGTYADIVHMIAKLQEQYTQNHEKLDKFENTYKTEFYENFKKESNKYKATLTDILDAQAFLLDSVLWKEAKTSKTILAYFNNLPVDVELNTKGYLKYYLNSIDEGKSSQNAKELFELYEYLQEVQKDCILILVESAQDAMEYEKELQQHCKDMKIKAFIDEVAAFKWAMSKPVKIIVIEEYINNTNAKRFLDYYHNAILSKPKIIVIGNSLEISAKKYTISKHLKNASSPKAVAKAAHDSCEEVS